MTTRFISFMSALALTALAGAASAGGMPAAGEQPYGDDYGAIPSSLTRAEVTAAAIATPPASGEQTLVVELAGPSSVTRAEVMAAALVSPPAAGEQNQTLTAPSASRRDATAVIAGLHQSSGHDPQAESNTGD